MTIDTIAPRSSFLRSSRTRFTLAAAPALALLLSLTPTTLGDDASSAPPPAPKAPPAPSAPPAPPVPSGTVPSVVGDAPKAAPKSATTPVANAPTPRELLDKHVKAIGGEEAARKQTSRTSTIRVELAGMPGVGASMTLQSKAPDKMLMSMNVPGVGDVKQGHNGVVGWSIDPMSGPLLLEEKALRQMKREADFHRDINLLTHYPTAETLGEREFAGGKCWDVKMSNADGETLNVFFDQGTGLMRGYEMISPTPMGEQVAQMVIAEYKEIDGVKVPSRMEQSAMGQTQVILMEKIDPTPIDDSVFELPMPIQAIIDRQKQSANPAAAPPVIPPSK
jgi:hypothetical protein